MARPGIGEKGGHQTAPETEDRLSEAELGNEVMGDNKLQGDDQQNVHNERHVTPDAKLEPDSGPVESARMLDKDERARAELGKRGEEGAGTHGGEDGE
jgi:hypothetical protein